VLRGPGLARARQSIAHDLLSFGYVRLQMPLILEAFRMDPVDSSVPERDALQAAAPGDDLAAFD